MIEVENIEALVVSAPSEFERCRQMSPFVWRDLQREGFMLLARAIPDGEQETGRIWLGRSGPDGLRFEMEDAPLLVPGPRGLDIHGCEDPTVVPTTDGCIVYYTGLDQDRNARLLYAEGPDIRSITKRGIAHATKASELATKEATVECLADDDWRLFFEYSRDGRSRVGLATCSGPRGPWQDRRDPFVARPSKWDCWHLSTGPLIRHGGSPGRRIMFYNGATREPKWAIGWVVIDDETMQEVARCETPLIAFDGPGYGDCNIVFAASLISEADRLWLYFARGDRQMLRATLRLNTKDAVLFPESSKR